MSKDGCLEYIGTHTGLYDSTTENFSHASFLSGRPAEMAGMITINYTGKIDLITDNSGHYAPEAMDMYRGIKKLQRLMPNVFTDNAQIELRGRDSLKITDFVKEMEAIDNNVKTKYDNLREERTEQNIKYGENIKSALSIKFDCTIDNLSDAIANMSSAQKEKLAKGFTNELTTISILDSKGKYQNIKIPDLIDKVISEGREDCVQILIDRRC